jgi:hypothetical protein
MRFTFMVGLMAAFRASITMSNMGAEFHLKVMPHKQFNIFYHTVPTSAIQEDFTVFITANSSKFREPMRI